MSDDVKRPSMSAVKARIEERLESKKPKRRKKSTASAVELDPEDLNWLIERHGDASKGVHALVSLARAIETSLGLGD